MEKVYIIIARMGQYEDHISEPIMAYKDLEAAKEACKKFNDEISNIENAYINIIDIDSVTQCVEDILDSIIKESNPELYNDYCNLLKTNPNNWTNEDWAFDFKYHDEQDECLKLKSKEVIEIIKKTDLSEEMISDAIAYVNYRNIYEEYVGLPSYFCCENPIPVID